MLYIKTNFEQLKILSFFHLYPLTDQDYKVMKKMKEPKEFNGYIFRLIRKYASRIPALKDYVKEVIDLRRMYKKWSGGSTSTHRGGMKTTVLKINMLLDALIADAEHKKKERLNE